MFLDKIVESTKKRIALSKERLPLEKIKEEAEGISADTGFPFEETLKKEGISFICEVKKASPSKGIIAEDFPYVQIAKEYEEAGASAISVLTEPDFFMGSDRYLKEISQEVNLPLLRKDFILEEYQIYEAKLLGASAILLISEILDEKTLHHLIHLSRSLGVSTLVESHSLPEMKKALQAGASIIGVNNRNLDTFQVDVNTSIELRSHAPNSVIFVSESGISDAEDIRILKEHGVDAVLIGETLMRSKDKREQLNILRGDLFRGDL